MHPEDQTHNPSHSPPPHPPRCPYCGHPLQIINVHGHGQCKTCGTNIQPCCDGEQCDPL